MGHSMIWGDFICLDFPGVKPISLNLSQAGSLLLESSPLLVMASFSFSEGMLSVKSIVLMSAKAFSDEILRKQLSTRGKTVKAVIGEESYLQTDHLLMKFRIVDMICSKGETGLCEAFTRLSIDINIW